MDIAGTSFRALGTTCIVLTTDPRDLTEAVELVGGVLDDVDLACSRFRPDSDLERVNATPGLWVHVGPILLEALGVAIRAAALTDGDVDPTVGASLLRMGYDRDFAAIERFLPAGARGVPAPGWRSIEVDAPAASVRIPVGVRLDLGATAKAFAADRAAGVAATAVGGGVLVGLGGDIAVAGGGPEDGWLIELADAHDGTPLPGHAVRIREGGLATSSTTVRRWFRGNATAHHVIDPGTGEPAAEVWKTVSVAAANCVDANVASTASIVRGEAAVSWLRQLRMPARLVRPDGRITYVAGWPQAEEAA
jgi:thiamine biosynthesis lipoprotein